MRYLMVSLAVALVFPADLANARNNMHLVRPFEITCPNSDEWLIILGGLDVRDGAKSKIRIEVLTQHGQLPPKAVRGLGRLVKSPIGLPPWKDFKVIFESGDETARLVWKNPKKYLDDKLGVESFVAGTVPLIEDALNVYCKNNGPERAKYTRQLKANKALYGNW